MLFEPQLSEVASNHFLGPLQPPILAKIDGDWKFVVRPLRFNQFVEHFFYAPAFSSAIVTNQDYCFSACERLCNTLRVVEFAIFGIVIDWDILVFVWFTGIEVNRGAKRAFFS